MRLLIVEDEAEMAAALASILSQNGCIVDHVDTLALAREALIEKNHDIVLLDRQLPDGEGIEFLKETRREGNNIPVIILTAHNTLPDRIHGLDEGADDYIGKPFLADELMARVRAAVRRADTYSGNVLSEGNISLDLNTLETTIDGQLLVLPRRETLLLKVLLRSAGRTVMRRSLEDALYGYDDEIQSNALDSQVSRLRKRLSDAGAGVAIHTIRGLGYLLRIP